MAADDSQDRNLPASQRKLRKAREEGQVARSRDLGHFFAVGVGLMVVTAAAPLLTDALQALLRAGLRFDAATLAKPGVMTERLAALAVSRGVTHLVTASVYEGAKAPPAGIEVDGVELAGRPLRLFRLEA